MRGRGWVCKDEEEDEDEQRFFCRREGGEGVRSRRSRVVACPAAFFPSLPAPLPYLTLVIK